jgi:hypothetical protein
MFPNPLSYYGLELPDIYANQIEELSFEELLGVIHDLTTALYSEIDFTSDPLSGGFDDYIDRFMTTEQKIAFLRWLCDLLASLAMPQISTQSHESTSAA